MNRLYKMLSLRQLILVLLLASVCVSADAPKELVGNADQADDRGVSFDAQDLAEIFHQQTEPLPEGFEDFEVFRTSDPDPEAWFRMSESEGDEDMMGKERQEHEGARSTAAAESGIQPAEMIESAAETAESVMEPAESVESAAEPAGSAAESKKAVSESPATKLKSVASVQGRKLQVEFEKRTGVSGYEVQISADPLYKNGVLTKRLEGAETTSMSTGALTVRERYFVRVRTYTEAGSEIVYSKWSRKQSAVVRIHILMIGNSFVYYNDLPEILADMTGADVQSSTEGGTWLKYHLTEKKEIGRQTLEMLSSGSWDYVVIQDRSNGPIDRAETFLKSVKKACRLIRKVGAEPILYATWAYKPDSELMASKSYSYKEMFNLLYAIYHEAGDANNAAVADVGEAFFRSEDPVSLYDDDGKHPNEAGSRLAAEVIAKTIFGN